MLHVVTVRPCRSFIRLLVFLGPALAGCAGAVAAPQALRAPVSPEPVRGSDFPVPVLEAGVARVASEPPAPSAAPPTWASIYARYLGPGTDANCAHSHCHASVMPDADSAYRWLAQRGYIGGGQPALVGANSCLRWFGGNMPPKGAPNESAARDLAAWAAAGALDN